MCDVFCKQSNSVNSYFGIRQGENLSPVIFSLFLNDLSDFLRNFNCSGINLNMAENDLDAYLKTLTLLYAATDPATFEENINAFFELAQNNRAKLHHTLQYSSDNKAAMNTGGLLIVTTQHAYSAIMSNLH